MINKILTTIFGSQHERDVKKLMPMVAAINELEPSIKVLSDDQLRAKTVEFREQLAQERPHPSGPFRLYFDQVHRLARIRREIEKRRGHVRAFNELMRPLDER